MNKYTEKITMQVTKAEAMMVLIDRLERKWYVDLEPVFIFLPCFFLSYIIYELIPNAWIALIVILPIAALCFYILYRLMRNRRLKAEKLYSEFMFQKGDTKTRE